jgi:hypothetical protein
MPHGEHSIAKSVVFAVFAGSRPAQASLSARIVAPAHRDPAERTISGDESREASVLAGQRGGIAGAAGDQL